VKMVKKIINSSERQRMTHAYSMIWRMRSVHQQQQQQKAATSRLLPSWNRV